MPNVDESFTHGFSIFQEALYMYLKISNGNDTTLNIDSAKGSSNLSIRCILKIKRQIEKKRLPLCLSIVGWQTLCMLFDIRAYSQSWRLLEFQSLEVRLSINL